MVGVSRVWEHWLVTSGAAGVAYFLNLFDINFDRSIFKNSQIAKAYFMGQQCGYNPI